MRRFLPLFLVLGLTLAPAAAMAVAFEEHSSWDKEPMLETERGVSLGMQVLELGSGFRYLRSNQYFNMNGNLVRAPAEFDVSIWDLFWRYGLTENWTLSTEIPVVWSEQTNAQRDRTADGKMGDARVGVLYQFFHQADPMVSMAGTIRWKLPTGSEVVGTGNINVTGTGTTDIELAYLGRWQMFRYMSLGWDVGYNIRFPGPVQYILDGHSSLTNASIDLGDEIHAQVDVIGGVEWVALHLSARFTYRFPTSMAIAEFRKETVRWENPATGEEEEVDYMLYNGARYREWDVVKPDGTTVSSSGFIFSLTPRIIIRPVDWLDFTLFTNLHVMGKNSIYLVDKNGDNASIDNFMPNQTLGMKVGGMVIGESGLYTTFRW